MEKTMNTFIEVHTKRDLNKIKPTFGIGRNDATYVVKVVKDGKQVFCPYYRVWLDMLRRCYDTKFHIKQPTYADCYVCSSWLLFSSFKQWMKTQDWEGKALDKDILVKGNKVYSPETCIFVTKALNNLLNTKEASRGVLKIGVLKVNNTFMAQISVEGKRVRISSFKTEEEAYQAYTNYKSNHIRKLAELPENYYLKEALLRQANSLLSS
jgi:hypothetical protein